MQLKKLITAASIALLPIAASAATYIVPAAGTGPGANNSHWQSELTLHNLALRTLTVDIAFHDTNGASDAVSVDIPSQSTIALADIVKTKFGRESATGGLSIEVADLDAKKLAIASRTFNTSDAGEFGQDIPAAAINDAAAPGDVDVLAGPSSVNDYRFNFGVFAVSELRVQWQLLRADGTVAGSRTETYGAGTQRQFNGGVQALFNAAPQNSDTVRARVESGRGLFYGSSVNQRTGDPTYVPGVRAREEVALTLGIDVGADGRVDIGDNDHDGVLDTNLDVRPSFFPTTFRVVATGRENVKPTFEIL
ncbi:MAG TPA: hypothetical protein VJ276_19025, partial [Thermoanaerobaculia bacterium]|nr:hypothetical protein [Thermoanaerobaculia bacterium]